MHKDLMRPLAADPSANICEVKLKREIGSFHIVKAIAGNLRPAGEHAGTLYAMHCVAQTALTLFCTTSASGMK